MLTAILTLIAQVDPASLPADLDVVDAVELLVKSLGGLKGATGLGIAYVAAQGVMLLFRTKLADFAGKWKLLISSGLTLVFGVIALKVETPTLTWAGALMHSGTLAAGSTWLHQLFKQIKPEVVT